MPGGSGRAQAKRAGLNVSLDEQSFAKLKQLADEADMYPGALAAALLTELLPSVKGVRRRLQVLRDNGAAPDA